MAAAPWMLVFFLWNADAAEPLQFHVFSFPSLELCGAAATMVARMPNRAAKPVCFQIVPPGQPM